MEKSDHRNKPKKSLLAMTSKFRLPLEGWHENLSAKLKKKNPQLNERDCHSVKSSIQR